jgi:hypothetical protein
MAEDNEKRPVGRPTKYKPEYCQQLIDYMAEEGEEVKKPFAYEGNVTDHVLGYLPRFFEGFAKKIGVTTSTIAEWRDNHEEFSEAYKKAKDIQLEKMVKGTMSGVYNSAGAIFALKNMCGWRDKHEVEGNVTFEPITFVIEKADED